MKSFLDLATIAVFLTGGVSFIGLVVFMAIPNFLHALGVATTYWGLS